MDIHMSTKAQSRRIYILLDNLGQMGNKLVLFSHLIAHCLDEADASVVFPEFAAHGDFFMEFSGGNTFSFPLDRDLPSWTRSMFLLSAWKVLFKTLRKLGIRRLGVPGLNLLWHDTVGITVDYDTDIAQSLPPARSGTEIVGLFGWRYRHQQSLETHADTIRKILRIEQGIVDRSKSFIEQLRKDDENVAILGIHHRGGDYRHEYGGRRFVEMDKLLALALDYVESTGRPHLMIVFSNEDVHVPEELRDTVFGGPGGQIEDFCTLSLCDRIIAPMSTFSGFAAFLGDVPTAVVDSRCERIRETDFVRLDYFGPRAGDA